MKILSQAFNSVLRSRVTDVPVGVFLSRLDRVAQKAGYEVTETLFRDSRTAQRLATALTRFFGDERGGIALRKAAHTLLEERLRIVILNSDPPDRNGFSPMEIPPPSHPVDAWAAGILNRLAPAPVATPPKIPFKAHLGHIVEVLVRVGHLVGQPLGILLRFGTSGLERRSYRLGVPYMVLALKWVALANAAKDAGLWSDDALFKVIDREAPDPDTALPCPQAAVSALAVDRKAWLREVVWPSLALAGLVLMTALRHLADPWTRQLAIETLLIGRLAIEPTRLNHNFRFEGYLDVEEYSPRHIVKAIVLGRQGTRMVRWPHSQMDEPGATLTYLAYDLFLSAGPYQADVFGNTWLPGCRSYSVGMVGNDRHVSNDDEVDEDIRRYVADHQAQGRRLVTFFAPSGLPVMGRLVEVMTDHLFRELAEHDDFFMIFKGKGYRSFDTHRRILEAHPLFPQLMESGRLLVVHYPRAVREPCPAGWLIQQMAFGVGPGSVQIESLTLSKPILTYYPVARDTPYQERLLADRLLHETPESLAATLADWFSAPDGIAVDYDWYRTRFDPFCDDRALTRVAEYLWKSDKDLT